MKKILSTVLSAIIAMMALTSTTNAHEMFYEYESGHIGGEPYVGIPISWGIKTSGKAHLKVNATYLSGEYATQFPIVYNAWQTACPNEVMVELTSYSNSNVDFIVDTQAQWNSVWGENAVYVLGYAKLKSTDGIYVDSLENAKSCSGLLRYAAIHFNPQTFGYTSARHMKGTIVHEIGHVLGLGHPNTEHFVTNVPSIMRQGEGDERYCTPQPHDITDISNKY